MEEPKKHSNGLPFCNLEILYLLEKADGLMERKPLREQLIGMGYGNYCVYEAFRRLEWQGKIGFIGSGNSKSQKIYLIENSEAEQNGKI